MTVSSTTSRWEYTGDGLTTVFAVNGKLFATSDLKVYLDGTLKTLSTHYTVTLNPTQDSTPGGDVTFLTAPAAALAVLIVREVANTQETDLPLAGPFPSEAVENELDRRTIVSQGNAEALARTLRFPVEDASSLISELPAAADRASKFVGFDGSGNVIAAAVALGAAVVSPYIETLIDDADAATARATLGLGVPNVIRNGGSAGGTANALTCTCSPALTALTDGALVVLRAAAANTSGAVTFAPDGLTAKTIKKFGNQGLRFRDISGADHVLLLQYRLANDVWELLNPRALLYFEGGTSGGTANAQTCTPKPGFSVIVGATIEFQAGLTNTAAATMNAGATGVKAIKVNSAAGPVDLVGGEIIANNTYTIVYDGTQFVLQNPTATFPKFHATIGADQVIPDNVATKVLFDTEQFDSNANYDPATNRRFTPTVAGTYRISARLSWSVLPTTTVVIISIYKNGVSVADWQYTSSGATFETRAISDLIAMNGTTDYVEIFVLANTTGATSTLFGGVTYSAFTGERLP